MKTAEKFGGEHDDKEVVSLCTYFDASSKRHLLFSSSYQAVKENPHIKIWDIESGNFLGTIETPILAHYMCVTTTKIQYRYRLCLYFAGDDRKIYVCKIRKGYKRLEFESFNALEGHGASITALTFDNSGSKLLSGSSDNCVRIWNITKITSHVCRGHKERIVAICNISTGSTFASASEDGDVFIWESNNGERLSAFQFSACSLVNTLLWRPNEFIVGNAIGQFCVYSIDGTFNRTMEYSGIPNQVKSVCWGDDTCSDLVFLAVDNENGKHFLFSGHVSSHKNEVIQLFSFSNVVTSMTMSSMINGVVFSGHENGDIHSIKISNVMFSRQKRKISPVNDSSRFSIDRLGYTSYAQAIHKVVNDVDPPLCIGLYGRWGTGKTFMIQRLKYNFDKSVNVHPHTNELIQWFEDEWTPSASLKSGETNNNKTSDDDHSEKNNNSCIRDEYPYRVKLLLRCCLCSPICSLIYSICGEVSKIFDALTCATFVSGFKGCCSWSMIVIPKLLLNSTYLGAVVWQLLVDDLTLIKECVFPWTAFNCFATTMCSFYEGRELETADMGDIEDQCNYHAGCMCCFCYCFGLGCCYSTKEMSSAAAPKGTVEYVFVDFNAWEFSRSDELWTGLIRNIYEKVELRLQHHNHWNYFEAFKKPHPWFTKSQDMKQKWRVQKAKELLIKYYGGIWQLRFRLWGLLFFVICNLVVIILSSLGLMDFWKDVASTVSNVFSILSGAIAVLVALPSVRLLLQANSSVNTSRGEAILEEANQGIKDTIGFMAQVRLELEELFGFMRQYNNEAQIQLKLVIFVDDLDRCLEDRPVKVLEAIQLLLAIPGAPIICFLAIDSRIVVASIEKTINESLSIEDALISGWEYMDKIVQLPFCLPEPSADDVESYIDSCIDKVDNVKKVCEILIKFRTVIVEAIKKKNNISLRLNRTKRVEELAGCSHLPFVIEGKDFLKIVPSKVEDNVVACTSTVLNFADGLKCPYCHSLVQLYNKSCNLAFNSTISNDKVLEEICFVVLEYVKTCSIGREHDGTQDENSSTRSDGGNVGGSQYTSRGKRNCYCAKLRTI